jgi:hypothetical protein
MKSRAALAALTAFALATPGLAAVDVRVTGQSVDVQASNAPLSEVLERLSRQTQMRVVYDGAPPRMTVTLDLRGRTPVEAVVAALEGQGVNYALAMDPTGTRVETLLVSGTAATTAARTSAVAERSFPREVPQEAIPEEPEPVPEDEGAALPPDTTPPGQQAPQTSKDKEAQQPEPIVPPAGLGGFSPSPFAPTAPKQEPPPQPQATPPPFNP